MYGFLMKKQNKTKHKKKKTKKNKQKKNKKKNNKKTNKQKKKKKKMTHIFFSYQDYAPFLSYGPLKKYGWNLVS